MDSKLILSIKKEMNDDEWYKLSESMVETYKNLIPELKKHNIELTFNKDFTKIKKTTWKNGKPI
jgi:hypothetical protein